jgi:hypothetical protein
LRSLLRSPRRPPRRETALDSQTRRRAKALAAQRCCWRKRRLKHASTLSHFCQPTRTGGRRGAWGRCRRPDAGSAASAPQTATVTKTCWPACPPPPPDLAHPLTQGGLRHLVPFSLSLLSVCVAVCLPARASAARLTNPLFTYHLLSPLPLIVVINRHLPPPPGRLHILSSIIFTIPCLSTTCCLSDHLFSLPDKTIRLGAFRVRFLVVLVQLLRVKDLAVFFIDDSPLASEVTYDRQNCDEKWDCAAANAAANAAQSAIICAASVCGNWLRGRAEPEQSRSAAAD